MKDKDSFTLIELLIVIVIIGVLTTLAIPQYQTIVARAKYAEAMLIVNAIHKAELAYFEETGTMTPDLSKLDIKVPPVANIPGGSYYGWTANADPTMQIGFGLGFAPDDRENLSKHKIGMDLNWRTGKPVIVYYWWRDDLPGQIGGAEPLHTSPDGWPGLK